ncbi:uncharacterized protein LOC119675319 [Teleopsis dalmanni]|uniref:uncharacterized protein LOC119664126 n=1 Tax=Teleopsis dalmanni TaxID=139649 RepID=UPI0018CF00C4|nr:uncharacterized protein LOC119664126 [Teleopsis dalmanni]XP_037929645.1 uncharacterized protein LOC119664177 [Teleopsis dalmanni]XP_037942442.1 uncharacterized protein LOC119675319 [Teleopsis dalmanni]
MPIIGMGTWDHFIPEVKLAINSAVSETTGYSPIYLVQGREARLPGATFDKYTPGCGTVTKNQDQKQSQLQQVFSAVRANIVEASGTQAKYYNLRRRPWRPDIGQLVWIKEYPVSKATQEFTAKLAPRYGCPYRITTLVSPVIVKATHVTTHQTRTAHVKDLKYANFMN